MSEAQLLAILATILFASTNAEYTSEQAVARAADILREAKMRVGQK